MIITIESIQVDQINWMPAPITTALCVGLRKKNRTVNQIIFHMYVQKKWWNRNDFAKNKKNEQTTNNKIKTTKIKTQRKQEHKSI